MAEDNATDHEANATESSDGANSVANSDRTSGEGAEPTRKPKEPAYNSGDEMVSIVTVQATTHGEAISAIEQNLTTGIPWDSITLIDKESLAGESSEQLFIWRISAENPVDW